MIRIIVVLALAYGCWWCYQNLDFNAVVNNAVNTVQSEKTIQAVTKGRQQNAQDVNNALGN